MVGDKKKNILESFAASYGELLRHLSRRHGRDVDADDVLQDTFLRLQSIPVETDIKNPRSYLFRMADNQATDHIRGRRSLERYLSSVELPDSADDRPSPERVVDYRQRLGSLEQAISELTPRQRQVFLMHKFDGLSHAEIARDLKITKSAVEKLVMKALAHLRDRLGDLID
ncbi:RNA polymerase sigma factor [Agrobacterium tumefaciens]|uniref:RNA polymerase sigma factor n=1 Tax=Agrobacterium tumefaciens TaxID=358 RepID=A0AAJ4TCZ6_AGRTU|nr:RNA polymerase sigma factor [Agrobacterium tumefaciens]MRH96963.1 sigma-70 family RNA polymerase sigma factor [Agrobacterium tumefaciens]QTG16483.1 RNA polymerase sigma factor [Agrobacterium tumefaciens]